MNRSRLPAAAALVLLLGPGLDYLIDRSTWVAANVGSLRIVIAILFLVVTVAPMIRIRRADRPRRDDDGPTLDWAPMLPPIPGPARLRIEALGPDAHLTGALPIELPDGAQAERLRDVLRAAGATVDLDRPFRPGGR